MNCGLSPRCPAVSTIGNGFCPCSQPRCSFVVRPPRSDPTRGRPAPARHRRAVRPPDPPFAGTGRVLVRPSGGGVHAHIPGDPPGRVRRDGNPVSTRCQVPSRCHRRNRPIHRPPRAILRWQISFSTSSRRLSRRSAASCPRSSLGRPSRLPWSRSACSNQYRRTTRRTPSPWRAARSAGLSARRVQRHADRTPAGVVRASDSFLGDKCRLRSGVRESGSAQFGVDVGWCGRGC
jgi:hypothetical protein